MKMKIKTAFGGLIMGLLLLAGTAVTASATCSPSIIGQLPLGSEGIGYPDAGGKPVNDMKVSGNLVFVAVNGVPGKLLIINAATPASPQLLSSWTPPSPPNYSTFRALAVSGNYVYIGGQNNFYVLDISNPTSPQLVGQLASIGEIYSVAYDNGKVYIGDFQYGPPQYGPHIRVIDVSNPASPVEMSRRYIPYGSLSYTAFASNGVAYIGTGGGFYMVNVSNPLNPFLLGHIGTYNSWGSGTISGTRVYETQQQGITVWDVTNPFAVVNKGPIGDIGGIGIGTVPSLALGQGNVLYHLTPTGPAFRVVDISSPTYPWPYRGAKNLTSISQYDRVAAPAVGSVAYAVIHGYTINSGAFLVFDTTGCPSNSAPTANAGGPYSGDFGSAIGMSGASASDPNAGDTLTYSWTVNSASCSFDDPSVLNPTLTCNATGNFTATFEVSDGVNPPVSSNASVLVNKAATTTTVSCAAGPYTYTGAAQTPCSASVTGPGLNLTPTPDYTNNTNAGTANASYTYAESANYLGSNDSQDFTIGKAATTTTVSCAAGPYTYTGAAQTPCSASVTGPGGLNLTPTPDYANNTNAGTANASYTYAESANYLGSNDSQDFTIGKAATTTTVSCAAGPYTYTGSAQTPCSAAVTGPGGLSETPVPVYSNNTNAGTANASYTYAENSNYLGSNDSENFTISKAGLIVTPNAQQILIGSPDPTFTFSYAGFVNSENSGVVDTAPTCGVTGVHTGVGSYTITCSGGVDNNYSFTYGTATLRVVYNFNGFFNPIDNLNQNSVKAGQGIPVKFSLSGNFGLNILAAGYPVSYQVPCSGTGDNGEEIPTVTAGNSSLSYDATTDQYNYVWKTDKNWTGTCRVLLVQLNDGSFRSASFKFK